MATEEYTREPCPMRIFDDLGGAFTMGVVGGGIFHSIAGFRNSAKGHRLMGMQRNALLRAPLTGGQFAAWGGMFSVIDCSMTAIRKKEDYLNSITAGGMTGAILTIRQGPSAMLISGVVGAVLLGMIEGVGVLINRWQSSMFDPTIPQNMEDPQALGAAPQAPGLFGGGPQSFFGGAPMPGTEAPPPLPTASMEEPTELDVNMGVGTMTTPPTPTNAGGGGGGWTSWLNWNS